MPDLIQLKLLLARSILAALYCTRLTGTNVVQARHRMRGRMAVKRGQKDESKEKVGNYRLREVKRGGKKQFLLIKKREVVQPPIEDIFTDWKANLDQEKNPGSRIRKPRVRKLSHRALRKAELKEEAASRPSMPLLYADVVKRNLKLAPGFTPIEDIFEAWRDYLQELDSILNEDLSIPSSPEPEADQTVDKKSMDTLRKKRDVRLEQVCNLAVQVQ